MRDNNKNLIVLVGGDHHNGLGLARVFGLHGYIVHSYVVGTELKSWIAKSKFVSFSRVFLTEKDAFDFIKKNYDSKTRKPIIIPYSDGAAFELDKRLNEFKDKFFVPSINLEQGKITQLMNKENQYVFAKQNGIAMADTVLIDLHNIDYRQIETIPFPHILKPYISASGDKKDICICNNLDELNAALSVFKEKNYSRVLLQEFLSIDYEIDVFGCVCRNYPYVALIPTHTIRSFPWHGGTNSFSQIITDDGIIEECKKIINTLKEIGFYGLFDIELFVVKGKIVLNEINLRNSGDVYMGLKQKYYYPIIWINDVLSVSNEGVADHPQESSFAMTECADLRNVFEKKCSLFRWFRDYLRTDDFALRFKGDMKPVHARYRYYLKQFLKRKKG